MEKILHVILIPNLKRWSLIMSPYQLPRDGVESLTDQTYYFCRIGSRSTGRGPQSSLQLPKKLIRVPEQSFNTFALRSEIVGYCFVVHVGRQANSLAHGAAISGHECLGKIGVNEF